MERIGIINEKTYQRIKKEMSKKDDYFSLEDMKQFTNIYKKNDVILT